MKKLFALHPSIIVDEFSSLRITGSYQLQRLSEQSVTFQTNDYSISITGEEVTVLALTEQHAHISVAELKEFTVRRAGGDSHGS